MPYWFLLAPLVVWYPYNTVLSSIPWPQYAPRKVSARVLWQLNRLLILRHLKAIVVISRNAITRELSSLLGSDLRQIEVFRHLPSYPRSSLNLFHCLTSALGHHFGYFHRSDRDQQGIYDIVEIARRLEKKRKESISVRYLWDGWGA